MKLIYTELPDDVEIVPTGRGQFTARSSERHFPMSPQPTPELARVACLRGLNARAVLDRVDKALDGAAVWKRGQYTREQYEQACDEAEVLPLPDRVCDALWDKPFPASVDDAEALVVHTLAMRRGNDVEVDKEARRQGKLFEAGLNMRFPKLSREQYERVCGWLGIEPAAEEQITELKVECFQEEETRGRGAARLPYVLAKWRDSGQHYARRSQ